MAQTEAKVTWYECDSPTCTKKAAANEGELPSGTIGTVNYITPDGTVGEAEWYAHAPVHFGKAVKFVLANATAETDDEGAEIVSEV